MSPVSTTTRAAPATAEGHAPHPLAAIDGRIQPVRIRPTYRLALLAITAAMLLLLLAYIALIGLIALLIGLIYTQTDFAEFTLKGTWGTFILFFMPGLVGCFVIGIMLKPLVSKYARPTPVILDEAEEPELYAYVYRLCDMLGARRPSQVQVDCRANASASFHEGRKGLFGGQLVLTMGLPLVAGLTLPQFTGVLAHEFGHFTQGTGMRLTYIVRSINFWFFCAVYERDGSDMLVERAARGGGAPLLLGAWLAKSLAWPTRRILWVLMCIGNLISAAMLRQMEFDADRYQVRVTGSDRFEETYERIEALTLAETKALDEIRDACRKNRLCDDFNRFVIEHEIATSPEARLSGLAKLQLRKTATDWFDTHPCHKDRVASARRENAPGIIRGDGPARALFHDFDALSRRASELYYRKDLGIQYDTTHLVSTESMVAASDDHEAAIRLLTRFFQGTINPICPLFPEPASELPANPEAIAEHLDAARRRMLDLAETARTSLAKFDAEDEHFISNIRSNALGGPLFQAEQQLHADRLLHAASFNAAVSQGMARINIALDVAHRVQSPPADPVVNALLALRTAAPDLEQLRRNFFALDACLSTSQSDNRSESIRQILDHAERTQAPLKNIHNTLTASTNPYSPPGNRTSLSQYAIGRLPAPNEIGAIHTTSQAALKSLYTLYLRLLSDLARQTETLETSHGLQPLPDPPNSETLKENLRSRFKF